MRQGCGCLGAVLAALVAIAIAGMMTAVTVPVAHHTWAPTVSTSLPQARQTLVSPQGQTAEAYVESPGGGTVRVDPGAAVPALAWVTVVALVLLVMVALLAVVLVVMLRRSPQRRREATRDAPAETELLLELQQGLARFEQRVDALETILLDRRGGGSTAR